MTREIGGRSERIDGNIVKTLKALFPSSLLTHINRYITGDPAQMSFPELNIISSEAPDDDNTGQLLSYKILKNILFSMATTMAKRTDCRSPA